MQEIEADKDWRNLELKKIEIICQKLDDKELNKLILKSTIPMIYAHWEGFVVSSLRKINKYLNSLEYQYNDFHINLLTNAYEENIKSLENSLGYDKKVKHLSLIFDKLTEDVKFGTKIDVKSNLKFQVLKDICLKFNLSIDNFQDYKLDLEKLLTIRNAIAHGESAYTFEKYQDIEKFVNLLSDLMDILHTEIDDFFRDEKYKRGV
ncbi:MAG: MAE_28990/MAE_18760 family HEPN-like nuclease [Sulfurovum sp.]